MASLMIKPQKFLQKTESKKSHSWWWDSHISPKNSRWLSENLEEMDKNIKQMLKLIEDDADSFAKKAEIYFKKRPELVAHVEEFYRIYRSLAEKYDHLTGELKRNVPSDIQSQGSGISDLGSEPCPSPDQRLSRRKSGPRAAGFEVFLGSGGSSSDFGNKEDDSSTIDYESGSDDSSMNNFAIAQNNSDEEGLRRKISELEIELRRRKEENADRCSRECKHGNFEDLVAKIAEYEKEMSAARERILGSDDEISKLKSELSRINGENALLENGEVLEPEKVLEQELRIAREKVKGSDREIANLKQELDNSKISIQRLQDQHKTSQKDLNVWKSKVDKEHREVTKLHDRIARYKNNLSERDQEIRALRETISNANKSLSDENTLLQGEITKLTKERMYLEDDLKEWDLRCQSLEEEVRRVKTGRIEMEEALKTEIEQLKIAFKVEIDEINEKVKILVEQVRFKDDRIEHLDQHLKELHLEHVELISESERGHKLIEGLRSKVAEMEGEIEKQNVMIRESAEEKREAIRQLCFSLEHYRDGYQHLRKAFMGNKRVTVMAS